MDRVISWQRFEGAAVLAAGLAIYAQGGSDLAWWMALLVFLAPDLGFAGYLFGPKVGAFIYNLVHVYAFGAVCIALGMVLSLPLLGSFGALWLAHSGLDRMVGYGLKSTRGFGFTHLGRIGRALDA